MQFVTHPTKNLIVNLDRHRLVLNLSESQWLDRVQLTWKDYALVRSGIKKLPERSLKIVSSDLGTCVPSDLAFHDFEVKIDLNRWSLPERYNFALYGRCRTTITSFDYLEKRFGWRLRFETLKKFSMSEVALVDAFATVSMQFITDVCSFLSKDRHFEPEDFFKMGLHSYYGNKNSVLGETLQRFTSVPQVLERMWGDLLPLLEENCSYRFLELSAHRALLQVTSLSHVAEEFGVKHLGNSHICHLKAGMMATAPCYINQPAAQVFERSCVHHGDSHCLFEITY